MGTETHSEDAGDRALPASSSRARTVSQVLISSALGITLVAALASSAQPQQGASFYATPVSTAAEPVASVLGTGLDESQQLDGAIEVLATANALESGVVSPSIEQARSELGMLLATYLAQQDAARRVPVQVVPEDELDLDSSLDEPTLPGLPDPLAPPADDLDGDAPLEDAPPEDAPPEDAPAGDAPRTAVPKKDAPDESAPDDEPATLASSTPAPVPTPSGSPSGTPTDVPSDLPTDVPTDLPTGPSSGSDDAPSGTEQPDGSGERVLPEDAVPAPDGVAPGELEGDDEDGEGDDSSGDGDDDGAHHDEDGHDHGAVTLDDVVVSATHLADLLGTTTAFPEVDVLPADGIDPATGARVGSTLADRLAEVVAKYAGSTAEYENGRIPANVLCDLSFAPGQSLRCDAAEQLEALAAEFEKAFGYALRITDSYRPYEDQVRLKAIKPYLAAVPGTSQHGWGLAIDVGGNVPSGTSAEYVWMRTHAPDYGWDNPSWARPNGSKPEPWHFEFFGAGAMPDRYTPAETTTPAPSPSPNPAPGPKPTAPPAPAPTPTPNPTPTPTPTPPPTDPPTEPTPDPTDEPTSSPTSIPTESPTEGATEAP
ncbi:D-alanyl-D-alanine carboxypeptidase family protein [Cellulosimicrobium sp. Marseille-Q4280]|uniref:M15 family metallopeptidase n=1 Tax=Cellulosimicrobium sp. Marseille-Q4280 TaxID=2937992 RepID=UPI002041DB46|nr:D-alanyl-D-alanine carboxypeptidase family protein [Cellulosimicrobium sp. Marseille-Q4280]